ncbi:MAG: hypothetical protein EB090_00800 [Verrucomicrobia bacterium]|nr:hypothetical protein [Verrucomicrobiota bacterium]
MNGIYQRLRKASPLLICVGIIFPWAVSPFGLQSCSLTTGSFLPESRSILRQWLPIEAKLDQSVDHKEDPSTLVGLKGLRIYYFDPLVVIFVLSGLLFWKTCKQGSFVRASLARLVVLLIWFYLTVALICIFFLQGDLWLQPGLILIIFGYAVFTFSKVWEFYLWVSEKIRNRNAGRANPSL